MLGMSGVARAGAAKPEVSPRPAPDVRRVDSVRTERPGPAEALAKSVTVSWTDRKLTSCLADLAKATGAAFMLDPALPADARDAEVAYSGTDVPCATALGHALRAAGLRYAIRSGTVWISTPARLARKVVYGDEDAMPESRPMGMGEAMALISPADDDSDYTLADVRQIRNKPWRQVEAPTVNPATGITDYPAPPVWIDEPDADSPRYKYTTQPTFLKPEYKSGREETATAAPSVSDETLAAVAHQIKRNPGWSTGQIIAAIRRALAE